MNQQTPHSKKNWYLAAICLTVIMLGISFYFFTANLTHVLGFIKKVNEVLTPIYAGAILAFLLLPVHEKSYLFLKDNLSLKHEEKRHSLSNGLAIWVSLSFAFFIIYLLLAMLLPQIYLSIENLFQSLPSDFTLRTPEWLNEFFIKHPDTYEKVSPYYETAVSSINDWIQNDVIPSINSIDNIMSFAQSTLIPNLTGVVSGVSQVIGTVFTFITDLLVAVIVSIYLLARKRTFAAEAKKCTYAFLPVQWADLLLEEVRNAYRIMSGFISGKLLDSFIIGIITLVGSHMLQFPYPVLIATVIGITNIIPFFGPFIGGVPCGVLIFFVSPIKCLYFIVFIVALQQFDGNILGPKILGESTGLGSFWVLFAIILFGGIFGLAGMLLGVPVFATFYSMMSRWVKFLLSKKDMPTQTSAYQRNSGDDHPLASKELMDLVSHATPIPEPSEEVNSQQEDTELKPTPKSKPEKKSNKKQK